MNSNYPIHEFRLSDADRAAFGEDLKQLADALEYEAERFLHLSRILAAQYLPFQSEVMHNEIRHNNGFIVIRNLPIDTELPETPADGKRPLQKAMISEAVLLGMVSALRYSPFSYSQEKEGALVHEIAPVRSKSNSVSSNGVVNFDFHTDGSHLNRDFRPHVLALLCLRDTGATPTKLSRLGDVLERMPPEMVFELMQSNFIHTPPDTFEGMEPVCGPVLWRRDDKLEVAVSTHNARPTTPAATEALAKFRALAETCHQKVSWAPGDMVIFNNLRCLHARGEIKGDRWLQRCYGNEQKFSPRVIDLCASNSCVEAA